MSRECFYETTWKPYGHGMVCSFLAIFSSLFAISGAPGFHWLWDTRSNEKNKNGWKNPVNKAHSEAGGACMSNQNSFRASLLCSLICLVSSSFGAFIRKTGDDLICLKLISILTNYIPQCTVRNWHWWQGNRPYRVLTRTLSTISKLAFLKMKFQFYNRVCSLNPAYRKVINNLYRLIGA